MLAGRQASAPRRSGKQRSIERLDPELQPAAFLRARGERKAAASGAMSGARTTGKKKARNGQANAGFAPSPTSGCSRIVNDRSGVLHAALQNNTRQFSSGSLCGFSCNRLQALRGRAWRLRVRISHANSHRRKPVSRPEHEQASHTACAQALASGQQMRLCLIPLARADQMEFPARALQFQAGTQRAPLRIQAAGA